MSSACRATGSGRLFGVGVGPGDPELITVKAQRVIRQAHVIAYPCARHGRSNARSVIGAELIHSQVELRMMYPVTTEETDHPGGYEVAISQFYDAQTLGSNVNRNLAKWQHELTRNR